MIRRPFRSIAAGVVLLALVVGLPLLLAQFGRSPISNSGSVWDQLQEPISDTVAFGVLTVAAWLVWAGFTAHVVVELAGALGLAARWRLPAFGPVQLGARRLVGALTMTLVLSVSQRAGALPALEPAPATAATDLSTQPSPKLPGASAGIFDAARAVPLAGSGEGDNAGRAPVVLAVTEPGEADDETGHPYVVVADGDHPWGLAERHLGDGLRWREIWELNQGVPQSDGRAWVTPDMIHPGWHLDLPDDATGLPTTPSGGEDRQDRPVSEAEPEAEPELPPEPSDSDEPAIDADDDLLVDDGNSAEADGADAPQPDDEDSERGEPASEDDSTEEAVATDEGSASDAPARPEDANGAGSDDQSATTSTSRPDEPPTTEDVQSDPAVESPSSDASTDEPVPDQDQSDSSTPLPALPLLGVAGTLISVGVARQLRRNHTRQTAGLPVGSTPSPVPRVPAGREALARADDDTAERMETALAHLAGSLRPREGSDCVQPRIVQVNDAGRIDVCLTRPDPKPPRPWRPEASGLIWVLDGDQNLPETDAPSPAPALATLGLTGDDAEILVDLEVDGVIALVGHHETCQQVALSMVTELATRSDAGLRITVVGDALGAAVPHLDGLTLESSWDETEPSMIDSSIQLLDARGWPHTWAARASGQPFDWPPSVWVTPESHEPAYITALEKITDRPGAGNVLLVVGHDPGCGLRVHIDADGCFDVTDLGLSGMAQRLTPDTADQVADLLRQPAVLHQDDVLRDDGELRPDDDEGWSDGVPASDPRVVSRVGNGAEPYELYEEPPHDVLVRLCGQISIDGARTPLGHRDTAVATYIALHTGRAVTVDEIQDAIWNGADITRKRVANIISNIRSAIGDAITHTTHGHLVASPNLLTDVALIEHRLAYAHHLTADERLPVLQEGLELVTGRVCTWPRAGQRSWVWIEHDHWIPTVETTVGKLTSRLARTCLELGDADNAAHAAKRGIEALGRREELILLLVEAHELQGDEEAARRVARDYERWLDSLGIDEHSEALLDLLDRYA